MTQAAGRIAGGLVLLITLWITVYWVWPSSTRVSYEQGDDATRGVKPRDTPTVPERTSPPKVAPVPEVGPTPEGAPKTAPKLEPPPEVKPEQPRQAVVPPEFIEHTVQKGDSFESIARKYYGASGKGSIIAKANPLTDPTRLRPGRIVLVPKSPANIQGVPAAPPTVGPAAPEEYIVQEGDTLSSIAQEVYGESRLWTQIRDANRDRLPDEGSLKIGQKLRIPPKPAR
jgi:nucleoid-associated protein YgaU